MPGPLSGYRIVDLTAMISGPLATMLLADQGADVIKVENPAGGDHTRAVSRFLTARYVRCRLLLSRRSTDLVRLPPPISRPGEEPVTDPNASDRTLAGRCLCGAVRYAVADAFLYAANCHCSNCRRATGSAFKPFAGIERDQLGITEGENGLMIFGDENAHDARCKVCGALLYSVVRDGRFVHVAMGTLVDDPTIRPSAHIFVGSKAPWFAITDDLTQYDEHVVVAGPAG